MGATPEMDCPNDEEKPVHEVSLSDFYMAETEVTQRLWQVVMGTSITRQKEKAQATTLAGEDSNFPMYYVNYDEALLFCQRLNKLLEKQIPEGYSFSLPTEAQWEYAARGGNKNEGAKYAGSNMIDAVAWYVGNSGESSHIVGSKRANALGIYDMSGNVWEWCKDWYANSYVSYDTNNPVGPSSGSYRVARGGGWYNSASNCRVARRGGSSPGDHGNDFGFRVVLLP